MGSFPETVIDPRRRPNPQIMRLALKARPVLHSVFFSFSFFFAKSLLSR